MNQDERNRRAVETLVKDGMEFARSIGNNPTEQQVRKEVEKAANDAERRKSEDGARNRRKD